MRLIRGRLTQGERFYRRLVRIVASLAVSLFILAFLIASLNAEGKNFERLVGWSNILALALAGTAAAFQVMTSSQVGTADGRPIDYAEKLNVHLSNLRIGLRDALVAEQRWRQTIDPLAIPLVWRLHDSVQHAVVESSVSIPELARRFRANGSRMVVTGDSGAGKSVLLAKLALEILDDQTAEAASLTPIILPISEWDPRRRTLRDWVSFRLEQDWQGLDHGIGDGRTIATALFDSGKLLLMLDGLDELAVELRADALAQIPADIACVLTSRPYAYGSSSRVARPLPLALRVTLDHVSREVALKYLQDTSPTEIKRSQWEECLSENSVATSQAAKQLLEVIKTPLILSLLRLVYERSNTNPLDLLDRELFRDKAALRAHIITSATQILLQQPSLDSVRSYYGRAWNDHHRRMRWATTLARILELKNSREIAWWEVFGTVPKFFQIVAFFVPSFFVFLNFLASSESRTVAEAAIPSIVCSSILTALAVTDELRIPRSLSFRWAGRFRSVVRSSIHSMNGFPLMIAAFFGFCINVQLVTVSSMFGAYYFVGTRGVWESFTAGYLMYAATASLFVYLIALFVGLVISIRYGPTRGARKTGKILREWFFMAQIGALILAFSNVLSRNEYATNYFRIASDSTNPMDVEVRALLVEVGSGSLGDWISASWGAFGKIKVIGIAVFVFLITVFLSSLMRELLSVPLDFRRATTARSILRGELISTCVRAISAGVVVFAISSIYIVSEKRTLALAVVVAAVICIRSTWYSFCIARIYYAAFSRLPFSVITLLDDMHRLGLMRRRGAFYYFRHAEIQDWLAPNPTVAV